MRTMHGVGSAPSCCVITVMKVIKAITPEKIKSSSSFMDVSEQDSFNSGGRPQKKCLMTFGPQKDNFSMLTNPPAMQETPVQFLGWEDPLEKG